MRASWRVFLAGVLAFVIAGAASGFTLGRRWGTWAAVFGVPIGVAVTLVGINLVDSVLQTIVPASGWYDEEVGILGAAVIALLLGFALLDRGRSGAPSLLPPPQRTRHLPRRQPDGGRSWTVAAPTPLVARSSGRKRADVAWLALGADDGRFRDVQFAAAALQALPERPRVGAARRERGYKPRPGSGRESA